MKPHDALSDIRNLLELLMDNELAIQTNPTICEHTGNVQLVTFKSHTGNVFEIQQDFSTIGEYRRIVGSGCYSVMLNDGSLLQASYTFRHLKLVKHRLAFYPCPFDLDRIDLLALGASELIELVTAEKDFGEVFLRSPIRFDYSPRDARSGHPASHMTLNWAHCRLGVTAPLSFGHFVRVIFRNFFPKAWKDHNWLHNMSTRRLDREIFPDEEGDPHLDLGYGRQNELMIDS
jgi:hypothetical protein